MSLVGGMGHVAWILEELGKDGGEYNQDTLPVSMYKILKEQVRYIKN